VADCFVLFWYFTHTHPLLKRERGESNDESETSKMTDMSHPNRIEAAICHVELGKVLTTCNMPLDQLQKRVIKSQKDDILGGI
jgi:hypothetical protein